MKLRAGLISAFVISIFSVSSFADDWATSNGSCFAKGDKFIGGGLSIAGMGLYGTFDMAFHDAISGGIGTGFNMWGGFSGWREYNIPFMARADFHPFNLAVLQDKVAVRDKLDAFVGFSAGFRIRWWRWQNSTISGVKPSGNPFYVREHLGVRYFVADNFFLTAEEGGGLGTLNLGVGLKF